MEHNYKISFKIGNASFEIESTDINWLKSKEKDYLKILTAKAVEQVPLKKTATLAVQSPAVPPKMTLNEFYRKYALTIKSRPTTAVFLIYYLQKVMKKDKIITSDVTKCFRDISYPNWNKLNMTDILKSAKRRALVNYVNKLWSLTTTGEDYVFNTIAGKKK